MLALFISCVDERERERERISLLVPNTVKDIQKILETSYQDMNGNFCVL